MNANRAYVLKSTGSWYRVLLDSGEEVDCRLRGRMRLKKSGLTNPVSVGDYVEVEQEQDEWMIRSVIPRKNYLIRKSNKLSSQHQIVASNLDLAVIIISLKSPRTSTGFIDRFLISCESFGIKAALLFNKIDILENEEVDMLYEMRDVYASIGYETHLTSLKNNEVAEDILNWFHDKKVLVFGHSGVGKSTLINSIFKGDVQVVKEVSSYHQKGTHTTTFAQAFRWHNDSILIDTPGIKEFGLSEIEDWQLSRYAPDFKRYAEKCQFNTCLHLSEPKCAVKAAVEEGDLELFRYKNYLTMLETEFGKI